MTRIVPKLTVHRTSLFIAVAALVFSGCATNTGNPDTDRRGRVTNATLGILANFTANIVVNTLANAGQQYLSGKSVDLADAAATGVWQSTGTINAAADYQKIVAAYSGGTLQQPAQQIADKVTQLGLPPGDPAVSNAIASGISNAADQFRP